MPDEKNEVTPAAPPPPPKGEITDAEVAAALAAPPAAPAAKDPPPPAPAKASREPAKVGADDELPDDADVITLPKKALTERLDRAKKSELSALYKQFGVGSREELEARLAKLAEHEAREEERRQAQLTKEEQLAEARARAEAERDTWRTKYEEQVQRQEVSTAQQHVADIAKRHIDPDFLEAELPRLAKYLTSKYSGEELADLPDAVFDDYWADRVAKKPKIGKDYGAPPPPVERRALESGRKAQEQPAAKAVVADDDYRPKKGETAEERKAINRRIQEELGINF